jgi:cytidyltransferase-like protein
LDFSVELRNDWEKRGLKIVLAGGVFDIIHPGHIHTLNAAKDLGDILVIVIATDKTAVKMKKRLPLHNQELRCELVSCLSMVDAVIIGNEDNIFETVKLVKPDVIALGYDQIHQEKFISDGCKQINLDIEIARLKSPIPELSSSDIEKKYGEDIHDL